jgi:hypothetical protein
MQDDPDVVVGLSEPRREARGVVNPRLVRWIVFAVISVSLVVCTVLCIVAIWQFMEADAV